MRGIPEATPITLTNDERAELEGLARSRKTEHRMRQRARIVLLAADGVETRAIGRAVGCTTGTASKWRVRYAEKRLAGLDETGNRGAEPKYGAETDKRILALLDRPPPKAMRAGPDRCWQRRSVMSMSSMSGASCAPRRSTFPGANPGARATIPKLPPRPPTWSGCTWRRPRMRSSSASTKSPRSRRWSGHRDI